VCKYIPILVYTCTHTLIHIHTHTRLHTITYIHISTDRFIYIHMHTFISRPADCASCFFLLCSTCCCRGSRNFRRLDDSGVCSVALSPFSRTLFVCEWCQLSCISSANMFISCTCACRTKSAVRGERARNVGLLAAQPTTVTPSSASIASSSSLARRTSS